MNIPGVFQRDKRHTGQMFHPMHHSVTNYWTEAFQKSEMKHGYNEDLVLNNIHLIPDPLKKNLADSLFNTETPTNPEKRYQQDQKMAQNNQKVPFENPPKQTSTLGGIGSFFSGVMNVLTNVMFRSRASNYYDCFDVDSQGQAWQNARTDVQDKNGQASDCNSNDSPPPANVSSEMNFDSRAAVTGCERKLNQVLHLLTPKQTSSPVWVRKRPKKEFHEPGSVEESFEDAFSPEDFYGLPNDSFIEYYSPLQYHCADLYETAAEKTKLNIAPVEENSDIIKDVSKNDLWTKNDDILLKKDNVLLEKGTVPLERDIVHLDKENVQLDEENVQLDEENVQLDEDSVQVKDIVLLDKNNTQLQLKQEKDQMDQQKGLETSNLNMKQHLENKALETAQTEPLTIKDQLVTSCEDKLSKLKALLKLNCEVTDTYQNSTTSRTTPLKTEPKEVKTADKRFKNPNRRCSKRSKAKLKCRIEDDLVFANEINIGTPPSVENSPMQHSVSFGDYFDEVSGRFRTVSTGSDDSFQIVFNDHGHGRLRKSSDCDSEDSFIVFEDSPDSCYVSNDIFESDSESEMSDSGCGITCKLGHNLTRTVSNLTDDALYESEDEVDFGMAENVEEKKTGLLLDEKKKQLQKCQPPKKVRFSPGPPKVHVMRVWSFAARQARAGHWERYAVDRERFKRRIADAEMALSWVLKPQHRSRVMFQRFMPWRNQLKRKELAEKKAKEEEERKREEVRQEEMRMEEERQEARGEMQETKEEHEMQEVERDVQVKREQAEGIGQKDVNINESPNLGEKLSAISLNDDEYTKKIEQGKNFTEVGPQSDGKQEENELQTETAKDVIINENTDSLDEINITFLNSEDTKRNTEGKDLNKLGLQNESVQAELVISSKGNKESLNSPNNNTGISNNLIIDDALAKKIQDLEGMAGSNTEIVRS